MKFIFLYRRITDIDHIIPIIYSLILKNIDPQKIIYTDYFIDKTTINLQNDPRIKFIKKFKIKFRQSLFIKFYNIQKISHNTSQFRKIFIKPIVFLIYKFISLYFFIKILLIILLSIGNRVIITDNINSNFHQVISRKLNVNLVSVPHGITLHNGNFKNSRGNLRFILPDLRNFKNYTNVVFYNKISLDVDKHFISNIKILGSARYCKQWIEIQKKIYSKLSKLFKNNKKTILFLLEKSDFVKKNNELIQIVKNDEVYKVINYIIESNNFNLIIKTHPSSKFNLSQFDLNENILIVDNDESYKTFQLTDYADIILGIKSGAICDSIILNKFFLLLDFCHPFKLDASYFLQSIHMVKSFDNFKNIISKQKFELSHNSSFINEFLGANKRNVLDDYSNFLINL